jgi:chemotaxis protein CheD
MQSVEAIFDRRHEEGEPDYNTVTLFSGDYYVSSNPNDMLVTILGSCISACICDPIAKVGGMNHFLLPGNDAIVDSAKAGDAARYGVFAMEKLINGILCAGGRKDRLEVKVFGGGNVINNSMRIGSKNAAFVRSFLAAEGLPIHSEDLEEDLPRRVHYFPSTGRAMMRKLRRKDDMKVVEEEARYQKKISSQPVEGTIDLF